MDCLVNGYVTEWLAVSLALFGFIFGIVVGVIFTITDEEKENVK